MACAAVFASDYLCGLIFVSLVFTLYETGTSLDCDGDTKVCLLKCLPINTLCIVEYPAI